MRCCDRAMCCLYRAMSANNASRWSCGRTPGVGRSLIERFLLASSMPRHRSHLRAWASAGRRAEPRRCLYLATGQLCPSMAQLGACLVRPNPCAPAYEPGILYLYFTPLRPRPHWPEPHRSTEREDDTHEPNCPILQAPLAGVPPRALSSRPHRRVICARAPARRSVRLVLTRLCGTSPLGCSRPLPHPVNRSVLVQAKTGRSSSRHHTCKRPAALCPVPAKCGLTR